MLGVDLKEDTNSILIQLNEFVVWHTFIQSLIRLLIHRVKILIVVFVFMEEKSMVCVHKSVDWHV